MGVQVPPIGNYYRKFSDPFLLLANDRAFGEHHFTPSFNVHAIQLLSSYRGDQIARPNTITDASTSQVQPGQIGADQLIPDEAEDCDWDAALYGGRRYVASTASSVSSYLHATPSTAPTEDLSTTEDAREEDLPPFTFCGTPGDAEALDPCE